VALAAGVVLAAAVLASGLVDLMPPRCSVYPHCRAASASQAWQPTVEVARVAVAAVEAVQFSVVEAPVLKEVLLVEVVA